MAVTLTVGTNSYVSVADADTYIANNFLSTDSVAQAWFDLGTNEKSLLLIRSCKELERMRYTGYVSLDTQTLAFPRNDLTTVPTEVIEAQIINAMVLSTTSINLSVTSSNPMSRGVRKYTIDDFSEEFYANSSAIMPKITSDVALQLLSPWLNGGFAIR